MKNVILFATFFLSFATVGQRTDLQRIQELNHLAEYNLSANRDTVSVLAQEALGLNGDRFRQEKVKSLLMLGMSLKYKGQLDSAFSLFTEAGELAKSLEMGRELGKAYWYRGKVYFEAGELDKARPEYKKAVATLDSAGEHEVQFKALNGLAYLEQKQGNLTTSLGYHMEVLDIVEQQGFQGYELRSFANIASIYLELGDCEKGLEFNFKSLQVIDTIAYQGHLTAGMIQRAKLYSDNRDSSLFYFNKALQLSNEFNLPNGFAYLGIGVYHEEVGNYGEAIRNFRLGLKESGVFGSNKFFVGLSRNYLALGNLDSAMFFAQQGYDCSQRTNHKQLAYESSKILADIFEQKGDVGKCNKFLYEHLAYKDSIFMGAERRKITELQVQLETRKTKKDVEVLKSEVELESFRRVTFVRVFSSVLVAVLILLVFLVYRHKRKQKIQYLRAAGLRNEIEKSQHDLHNQSLHLIRVNNNVLKIQEKLRELKPKVQDHSMEVQRLINTIRVSKSQDKDWENFNNYFHRVNSGYADVLREHFPNLSINETRLCFLLKMNLLNSEIASILNVETRSVTMSKYRLKKKLGLDEEVDLTTFLINLDQTEHEKQSA